MVDASVDQRRSPLINTPIAGAHPPARIDLVGFRTLLNLRGQPSDDRFLQSVTDSYGVALPLTPNRWSGSAEKAALWLGPDEWLLIAPDGEAQQIETAIRAAVSTDPWLSLVDVSHSMTGFSLSGAHARDVLAKGCPLDLHARSFADRACAQTILAKTRMVIRLMDDQPRFEIWVRTSFARYVSDWLSDAAREYAAS